MGSSYCALVSIAVAGFCAARVKALGFCLVFLALPCCFAQDPKTAPGSIAGEVFSIGADGQRAVVPGAPINLSGPAERQTHFDARDVQNNLDSYRFGSFFNSPPRTFRGKFVLGF